MRFKKKYAYIALGTMMMSYFAFGCLASNSKIQEAHAIEQTKTWDFSDEDWQSKLRVMGDPGIDITKTWDITVDGLNFYSLQKNRWNTTYIQLSGGGSITDRVFTFTANYSGKLYVTASNTGNSEASDRNVIVEIEEKPTSKQSKFGGTASSSPVTLDFEIESGVQKIYTNKALRIYKIEYTYSTPERTLESIYIAGTATKLNYTAGEEFDPAGLKVMGVYNTGEDTEITTGIEWTFSPEVLTADTTSVTVSATANGKVSEPLTVDNIVVTSGTPKVDDKFTVADVLPDDFPVLSNSIPDDVWVNENGSIMGLFEGHLVSMTSDFKKQLSIIEDVSTTVLTKSGDNYLAGNEYIQITFNCVNDIATSIKVEGLSGAYATYAEFNGTYSEPKIKDSSQDLTASISAKAFIENGIITILAVEDGYRMELELYTDPANQMIPAGTYVISDSNEAGTALKSEGFNDDAPLKSYIALVDKNGNITDCWLLYEGTVSLSKGIVTVDATNSKGKSISVSATVYNYYTVTISVNDQTMGNINLTTIQDVRKGTSYIVDDNVLCVGEEEIIATANEGYEFDCWKIGETKATENGTITADTTFTAVFKENQVTTYEVKITSTNGTVDIEKLTGVVEGTQYSVNGNKLTVGDTEITATANEGYEFDCWKIGETKVTENGTITADTTFTATFKVTEKTTPVPENNGLSGGAIAGISVGSVVGVALITYVVMFVVYAKSGKGLKFLFKSFDWLKKLFKMK